eukprot:gene6478-10483_t
MSNNFEQLKVISLSEVKEKNEKGKIWTVIDGRVFDLTEFSMAHPGGSSVLEGEDDKKDHFLDAGHSESAYKDSKNYIIGRLPNAKEDSIFEKKDGGCIIS